MITIDNPATHWGALAAKALVGRTIVGARYLTEEESRQLGWYNRTVILKLDDGSLIWPSRDDEGNGAGAMFTNIPDLETIPVI